MPGFLSFFMNENTENGHNVPFLESASLKKRKRMLMTRHKMNNKRYALAKNNKQERQNYLTECPKEKESLNFFSKH